MFCEWVFEILNLLFWNLEPNMSVISRFYEFKIFRTASSACSRSRWRPVSLHVHFEPEWRERPNHNIFCANGGRGQRGPLSMRVEGMSMRFKKLAHAHSKLSVTCEVQSTVLGTHG